MRKWNAIISMGILALFLIHAAVGGLILAGIISGGSQAMRVLAWIMAALIAVHVVIGIKLTVDSLLACKRAGVSYFRENKLFWTRRISGFAIMAFIFSHVIIFMGHDVGGAYRLNFFGTPQMILQLLLAASVAVHVITNVNPLLIALGRKRIKRYAADILLVISVLLLFAGIAFIIYYIRWM